MTMRGTLGEDARRGAPMQVLDSADAAVLVVDSPTRDCSPADQELLAGLFAEEGDSACRRATTRI